MPPGFDFRILVTSRANQDTTDDVITRNVFGY